KGATAAHGNCLTRLFPPLDNGLRFPHPAARLGASLALCDRCPCSAALFLPQAARGAAAFDKILPKTAHSSQGSSHTILSKISLAVSPPSAHVRRGRRV